MDLKDFLTAVLPPNGTEYYGVYKAPAGKLYQTKLSDINALENYIVNNSRNDVYFATGSYSGSRRQEDAEFKKAFYVDLDVGAGKYATKKEAVTDLLTFCKRCFLDPSIIIDSGGGIHAYWVLTVPVTAKVWAPVAAAFKDLCLAEGFGADPSVTADSARILRPPHTINYKHTTPAPVRVVHEVKKYYTIDDIKEAVKYEEPAGPVLALVKALDVGDDFELAKEQRTYYAEYMVKSCPMFKDALSTAGAELPEILWMQQLHVLAYCEDGEDYIHKISSGHSGYAEAETRMKWNQRVQRKSNTGPTRCDTFSKYSTACATCPFNGEITTPLQLGTSRDITLPYPYDQDEKGVFRQEPILGTDGSSGTHRVLVTPFKVEGFEPVVAPETIYLLFEAVWPDKRLPVEIDYALIGDKVRWRAAMAENGLVVSDSYHKECNEFMSTFAERMQEKKRLQRMWTQLGWATSPEAFALADEVLFPDGSREKNVHSSKNLALLYRPVGERQPWIEAAQLLTGQGRHTLDAIVLTAFAAPLMKFIRDPSAALAFVSTITGSGKTTAMQVAQAVWGHPTEGLNQLDDTQNSIFKKMGYLNNLPAYWDEVRVKDDPDKFMRLVFQLTGGKERTRLTQNTDMRVAGTWNTILSIASNESIADHAVRTSKDSEAGRARIFQFDVPHISTADPNYNKTNGLLLDIRENYGVIGVEYASFLIRNKNFIKELIKATNEKLRAALLTDNSERFWLASVVALYVAARLTNKLKYTNINLSDFDAWLFSCFKSQQRNLRHEYVNEADRSYSILMDFISEYRSQIIVYENLSRARRRGVGKIYTEPKHGEIVAAIAIKDGEMRVNRRAFNDWVYNTGAGTPSMILRNLNYTETRGKIDAGKTGDVTILRTYDIPLSKEIMDQLGDE